MTLQSRTIFITGASRGIGREIALTCARAGANIVIAAKTDTPHPKLPGTIHDVAAEVEAAGGRALPLKVDVRDDAAVADAMARAADTFGGIDAVINNAGAINLKKAADLEMKRFDLMHQINTRAVLSVTQAALPWLRKSDNAHVLSLSPPLNLDPKWLGPYIPYTVTKYAMTLLSLGLAEELRSTKIAVNTLWPRTMIATAAVEFEVGADNLARARKPAIMADAAFEILKSEAATNTARTLLDEEVLREAGMTDFDIYANDASASELQLDLYVDS